MSLRRFIVVLGGGLIFISRCLTSSVDIISRRLLRFGWFLSHLDCVFWLFIFTLFSATVCILLLIFNKVDDGSSLLTLSVDNIFLLSESYAGTVINVGVACSLISYWSCHIQFLVAIFSFITVFDVCANAELLSFNCNFFLFPFRGAAFADDAVKSSSLVLLTALADTKEDEDDDKDCDYAYANSNNHHHVVTSFFFNICHRLRNGCHGLLWLWLRCWFRFRCFHAASGCASRVHSYNSELYNTTIVFNTMNSNPLLRRTEFVPFCNLGLPNDFVTELKYSWIVSKFNMLDTIYLSILNFEVLDVTVDFFFLTITIFEA